MPDACKYLHFGCLLLIIGRYFPNYNMDNAFSHLYSVTRGQTEKMAHNLNKIDENIIKKLTGAVLVPRDVASRTRRDTSLKILAVVEKLININYQLETIASEDLGEIPEQDHSLCCRRTEVIPSARCLEGSTQSRMPSPNGIVADSHNTGGMNQLVVHRGPSGHQPEFQQKQQLPAEAGPEPSSSDDVFKDAELSFNPAQGTPIIKETSPEKQPDSGDDQKTREFEKYYAAMYIRRTGGGEKK